MLHTETVSTTTLELLKRLMGNPTMSSFALVGGTALALQMGHRISIDLDFFCNESFSEENLRCFLEKDFRLKTNFISNNTLKGEIAGVKIDCIAHRYPWIKPFEVIDGIRLASLEDICAMKLNAITGNGTRIKDYIDIAFLSTRYSLTQMLDFYERKYQANTLMPLKSLVYFEDVNVNEPVRMINSSSADWNKIKKRLMDMERNPQTIFRVFP